MTSIQIRSLGSLEPDLLARVPHTASLSTIAKHHLERYYALLSASLPVVTRSEAQFLVAIFDTTVISTSMIELLWALIEKQPDGLFTPYGLTHATFLDLIQEWTPAEWHAITDAYERYQILRTSAQMSEDSALTQAFRIED